MAEAEEAVEAVVEVSQLDLLVYSWINLTHSLAGGGSSSGSSSSGGGRTSSGSTGSTSSAGGTSRGGSGAPRSYGGGGYYGGGASRPYTAGQSSPSGLRAGPLLGVAGLGALGFGGLWLASAYLYSYPRPYGFYNRTANANQTKPVDCLCQENYPCGCDENDDSTYINSIVGDGSPSSLNSSLIRVADVNGTSTILLNGTLPLGTTADDATATATVSGAFVKLPPVINACLLAFAIGSALLVIWFIISKFTIVIQQSLIASAIFSRYHHDGFN